MRVGDVVDDFELPDQTWTMRQLSTLVASGPVVLFFYPAAFNPLCTIQHCHFRDTVSEFAKVGARPVGISADPVQMQADFTKRHELGYVILSDVNHTVGRRFDVERAPGIRAIRYRRHTYIIGRQRKILDIIRSEIRLRAHADLALQFLRNYEYKAAHRAPTPPAA